VKVAFGMVARAAYTPPFLNQEIARKAPFSASISRKVISAAKL